MPRQPELTQAEQDWQTLFLAAQQGGEGFGKSVTLRRLLQDLLDQEEALTQFVKSDLEN